MDNLNLNRQNFLKLMGLSSLLLAKNRLRKINNLTQHFTSPNFLILVFDAFSARHLNTNKYHRETTPNLDHLSQNSIVFHQHHAGGNFTTPGTASLLTGVYPWTHRALHIRGKTLKPFSNHNIFSLLPKEYYKFAYTHNPLAFTLLHQFRASIDHIVNIPELAIYADSISHDLLVHDFFVSNEAELIAIKNQHDPPSSLFLSIIDSFLREIRTNRLYSSQHAQYPDGVTGCQIWRPDSPCFLLNDAIDWLQIQLSQTPQPFLGYIHLLPPHAPYNPPRPYTSHFDDDWKPRKKTEHVFSLGKKQTNLNRKRKSYDQYIQYLDSEIGRLFEYLTNSQLIDNTYIFITSDHGELFERGIIDHLTPALFEPVVHIPLFLFKPGQQGRIDIHTPTSAVDILPTILKIIGKEPTSDSEGLGLLKSANSDLNPNRTIYSVEAKQSKKIDHLDLASFSMITSPFKLVLYRGYPETNQEDLYELYDLEEDPEELRNIYDPSSHQSKILRDKLLNSIDEKNHQQF
jgi:arylsulfatase A-like enzyme